MSVSRSSWTLALALALSTAATDQLAVLAYHAHSIELARAEPRHPVDAAVVFFSGLDGAGELDAETLLRLDHALALFRSGQAGHVLCSGGAHGAGRPGAELMAAYLVQRGIPANRVHAEAVSHDTTTNLEHSLAYASQHAWRALVLVSSPAHLVRIRHLARGASERLEFSGYREPRAWLALNRQIHHEWVAWAAYACLPPGLYRSWVARWRGAAPAGAIP